MLLVVIKRFCCIQIQWTFIKAISLKQGWTLLFQQDLSLKKEFCSRWPTHGISVEKVIFVNYLHVTVLLLSQRAGNKWREQCSWLSWFQIGALGCPGWQSGSGVSLNIWWLWGQKGQQCLRQERGRAANNMRADFPCDIPPSCWFSAHMPTSLIIFIVPKSFYSHYKSKKFNFSQVQLHKYWMWWRYFPLDWKKHSWVRDVTQPRQGLGIQLFLFFYQLFLNSFHHFKQNNSTNNTVNHACENVK